MLSNPIFATPEAEAVTSKAAATKAAATKAAATKAAATKAVATTTIDVLVVAIGHRSRRDDGVGGALIRRLEGRLPEGAEALDLGPNPLRLFDVFERAEREGVRVIVADAVASGSEPGTHHRFTGADVLDRAVQLRGATSSHGFDLAATLALADRLGRLPDDLVIFGIEIGEVVLGEGLSPAVATAVEAGVDELLQEVDQGSGGAGR